MAAGIPGSVRNTNPGWLKERHADFKNRSEHRQKLRPPMGEQMQVDLGEVKIKNLQGIPVKLWFITFVLSHSRYKFIHWQDRPFVTKDVIDAHELAFVYYGGMTRKIVYDQVICCLRVKTTAT
ncbi:DDE-type integrase/transposase/recombinase [Paenibacillus naphthalenovorans]|nr:DDE-type integrase/transposase/recombinase [Paenibacillus naphthalenovorans]